MSHNAAIERHPESLRRIAIKLLALAVRAERTAGRSWLVRCFVLWLLGIGEKTARDYAAEAGAHPLILADHAIIQSGAGLDEAERLAASLRALAAIFFALCQALGLAVFQPGRHHAPEVPDSSRPHAGRLSFAPAGLRSRAPPLMPR